MLGERVNGVGVMLVAAVPTAYRAAQQAELGVDDFILVKVFNHAQAVAFGAGADGVVERE